MRRKFLSCFITAALLCPVAASAVCLKYVSWSDVCLDANLTAQNSSTGQASFTSFVAYPVQGTLFQNGVQVPGNQYFFYDSTTNHLTGLISPKYQISFFSDSPCIYPPATKNYSTQCVIASPQNSQLVGSGSIALTDFSVTADGHLLHNGVAVPGDKYFEFDPMSDLVLVEVYPNNNQVYSETYNDFHAYPPQAPGSGPPYMGYVFTNCTPNGTGYQWDCTF
ncbi:hypothetical protein [Dyella sp.]|uniref:hypothetical protein n=1 Tax=Dyella sp. TaxID=1869338 RepID=UPI002ED4070F